MDASLEPRVVAGFVFACPLSIPRPGPVGKVIDQELIALAVAQAVTGPVSDRQLLGTVGRLLPGYFPELPDRHGWGSRRSGLGGGMLGASARAASSRAMRVVNWRLVMR
jgi:hypothetical protein